MSGTRAVEMLAALSLTTDLATGAPFEKGLRVCLAADELGAALDLDPGTREVVLQAALLRSIGCTSHAPENAEKFDDDVAFQAALQRLDPGDHEVFAIQLAEFGSWSPGRALAETFLEIAPTVGPRAASSGCEVSRALAPGMGAPQRVVRALDDVYERWDGLGIPLGRAGEDVALEARVLHTAEQLVLGLAPGGPDAFAEVRRRRGGHLDPAVADAALANEAALLARIDVPDLLEAVLVAEPTPHRHLDAAGLAAMCDVLGTLADLKSLYMLGHSRHVATLATAAGARLRLDQVELADLTCAALLHNLGCVVVPSSVLDGRTDGLSAAGRERLRLQAHWAARILNRCPSLARLVPLVRPTAGLHASFAEDGHRSWERQEVPGSGAAQVLEAAEVWATLREPRPGCDGLNLVETAELVATAVADGRLDGPSVDAVRAVAGAPASRRTGTSTELTAREVQVVRLASRGQSNREIAAALGISDRTVGHHLAHVYDKIGRRTRAGMAVWAIAEGLLPDLGASVVRPM